MCIMIKSPFIERADNSKNNQKGRVLPSWLLYITNPPRHSRSNTALCVCVTYVLSYISTVSVRNSLKRRWWVSSLLLRKLKLARATKTSQTDHRSLTRLRLSRCATKAAVLHGQPLFTSPNILSCLTNYRNAHLYLRLCWNYRWLRDFTNDQMEKKEQGQKEGCAKVCLCTSLIIVPFFILVRSLVYCW